MLQVLALAAFTLVAQVFSTPDAWKPKVPLNFDADFSEEVKTFKIAVHKEFIKKTVQKAELARFPVEIEELEPFEDGPPRAMAETIQKHWARNFDWETIQDELNSRFHQFTTLVHTPDSPNFTSPIPLHFVHHTSTHPDAIPLLFVHGWPGSFLEVENLLKPLTSPPNASVPAFHVVAPSIPGFGFSPSPEKPGFGARQAGRAFHALMKKLGYDKYVIQGGDAGDFVLRFQAHDHPDSVVAGLSNFWVTPASESDLARHATGEASDDENAILSLTDRFFGKSWGYGQIQQTRPLRLAYAMTDSPLGLAMWIYEAVAGVVVDPAIWTPDRIITWTMMHWIPGPYAAFRFYKNEVKDGAFSLNGWTHLPYVKQPMAISQFPGDIWYRTPLEWAQRDGNVIYRTVHEIGGHFPALDTPELLLDDIWKFFSEVKSNCTSGTLDCDFGQSENVLRDEL